MRTGNAVDIHGFAPEDPRWRDYIHAMHQLARLAAPEVAGAIPLPRGAKHVLDLGGAHGWFTPHVWWAGRCGEAAGSRSYRFMRM